MFDVIVFIDLKFTVMMLAIIGSLDSNAVYCDVFIILDVHCDIVFTVSVVFGVVIFIVLDCVHRNCGIYVYVVYCHSLDHDVYFFMG